MGTVYLPPEKGLHSLPESKLLALKAEIRHTMNRKDRSAYAEDLKLDTEKLLKMTPGELVDLGVCPTCLNRRTGGAVYGDNTDKLVYEDRDIECFFVGNPRARGHMCISAIEHYHDLSEAPDRINEKIIRFARQLMIILKEEYQCERVYLCSMCDGPVNHYHVQLIPRYSFEKRGSSNFVKQRSAYVFEPDHFQAVKEKIGAYAEAYEK